MAKASSLRPHIVQLAVANKGRILSTDEIYRSVADLGVGGFDPKSMRDRNLVNRELSDLAGCSTQGHSKPALQILTRVSRGYYLYREPTLPMEVALLQEYLEPVEVYEKRPPRPRRGASDRRSVPVGCGRRCMRCSGVYARGADSTSQTNGVLRLTTSWRLVTMERIRSVTCSCCAPTAIGRRPPEVARGS